MFPHELIKSFMIKEINEHLNIKIMNGEFLSSLGLWFFMATITFGGWRKF